MQVWAQQPDDRFRAEAASMADAGASSCKYILAWLCLSNSSYSQFFSTLDLSIHSVRRQAPPSSPLLAHFILKIMLPEAGCFAFQVGISA